MRSIRSVSSSRLRSAALLTLLLASTTSHPTLQGQSPREWRDYAGGPDSSRFVGATQITASNVGQLQVAWAYPDGQTDFNPLVVRGTVYGLGAGDALVALDAATGREIWKQPGLPGFNVRGINYWEGADGADRRLLFVHANFLQALEARTALPVHTLLAIG